MDLIAKALWGAVHNVQDQQQNTGEGDLRLAAWHTVGPAACDLVPVKDLEIVSPVDFLVCICRDNGSDVSGT